MCTLQQYIISFYIYTMRRAAPSFRGFFALSPRAGRRALLKSRADQRVGLGGSKLFFSTGAAVNYNDPSVNSDDCIAFGEFLPISSQSEVVRPFSLVKHLGKPGSKDTVGDNVWIRGRVAAVRKKGKSCFLVLRSDSFYTVQACHFVEKDHEGDSKELLKFLSTLNLESIVDIYGTLQPASVKSCSQDNVEVHIKKVYVVSKAPPVLPFLIEDASRSVDVINASHNSERPFAAVAQDVRLNNRWLDLRVPANNAIMKIRSGILRNFRESLYEDKFTEINTPKLIAGASEGGADVFKTDYFGTSACLAQSPQLYKQMAISSDLKRVFEVGPVFRAEKSNTRRHLCEFTGLDMEMEIESHYNETLNVVHKIFRRIFSDLEASYGLELSLIRSQYPSSDVTITESPVIIHWKDGIQMLRDAGHEAGDFDDLTSAQELLLGTIVKERYHTDFFILDQYPSNIRPFYTMLNPKDTRYSNSYDMFLRGQEICSGAQRCHDPQLLEAAIINKGIDPEPLRFYIDCFRHGISPHAGAGIGLDRVVFLYLGNVVHNWYERCVTHIF